MDKQVKLLNDWIVDDLDDPGDAEIVFNVKLSDWGMPTEEPPEKESDEWFEYLVALSYRENGLRNLEWALPRSESPIEKIFLFHLVCGFWEYDPFLLSTPLEQHLRELEALSDLAGEKVAMIRAEWLDGLEIYRSINFVPQLVPAQWPEGQEPFDEDDDRLEDLAGMRIDLVLARPAVSDEFVAVELDGYEWHKDKFTEDRQRDRLLRQAGFDVLRFSGSEIVNEPAQTARELRGYCISKWGDLSDEADEG